MKPVSVDLTVEEWGLVLKHLGAAPINEALMVFFKIKNQVETKIRAEANPSP